MMWFNVNRKKGNWGQTDKGTPLSWRKKMGVNHPPHSMTLNLSFRKGLKKLIKDSVVQKKQKN